MKISQPLYPKQVVRIISLQKILKRASLLIKKKKKKKWMLILNIRQTCSKISPNPLVLTRKLTEYQTPKKICLIMVIILSFLRIRPRTSYQVRNNLVLNRIHLKAIILAVVINQILPKSQYNLMIRLLKLRELKNKKRNKK